MMQITGRVTENSYDGPSGHILPPAFGGGDGSNRFGPFISMLILAFGLAVTVVFAFLFRDGAEKTANQEFEFICNEIRLNIVDRLEVCSHILRGGASLFYASEKVSRGEWKIFTEQFQIDRHLQGIQGIGFSLVVTRDGLASHENEIRAEGFPDYGVRPAGDRAMYTSIIYLESFRDRNLRAFGFDMFSEPVRRAAMERARDNNSASLSGKVILVQETDRDVQSGALMYVPVYRCGMPVETVEERRAAIAGWVYSPYRMNDLMRGTLRGWEAKQKGRGVSLRVYDGDTVSVETLMHDSAALLVARLENELSDFRSELKKNGL